MRFVGPPVTGAPFSATAVYTSSQTLADGTRIERKSTGSIARDAEGRLRREMELNVIGPFAISGDPPRLVVIDDPVAEVHYTLDPKSHVARELPPPPPDAPPPGQSARPPETEGKSESLGKKTIGGVEAEGTRTTITIPAGKIGNDRPLEIVSERWYSPELDVIVRSSHRDPRIGETTYQLTDLRRQEPDRSLFVVPNDYKLERPRPEDRGPDRDRRRGPD